MAFADKFIKSKLDERRAAGNYRTLKSSTGLVDFCSNDYLGFARSAVLKDRIQQETELSNQVTNGSTGSRLLTGNSAYAEELERSIAAVHGCGAGLIFNSGYDANVGLFSSVPQRGDTIITDELVHASIIDGARLSHANRYTFKHNDVASLEEKLKHATGNCYVAIESVYSMDGDTPPLIDILNVTERYNANLIVDEAHAIGVFGYGLITAELSSKIFARLITFGKAMGCHGAIVLGSDLMRDYLVNFARSFIYTTAPPFHQLASIKMSYELLAESSAETPQLKNNVALFKTFIPQELKHKLISSDSAIQCVLLNNAEQAKLAALQLQNNGLDVRAILSPTVPKGTERIRICLHSFNTEAEIILLTDILNKL